MNKCNVFIFSLCSVMLNTPKTFKEVPSLRYITYAVDIICLIFFIAEMITKIKHLGLIGTEKVTKMHFIISWIFYWLLYCHCSDNLTTSSISFSRTSATVGQHLMQRWLSVSLFLSYCKLLSYVGWWIRERHYQCFVLQGHW